MDGSREYINVGHSQTARKLLSKYPLGVVAEADAQELASKAPAASSGGGGGALADVGAAGGHTCSMVAMTRCSSRRSRLRVHAGKLGT